MEEKERDYTDNEKIAIKYNVIKEKILVNYERGCRYLKIAKIAVAITFVIYTVISFVIAGNNGKSIETLIPWIAIIFALVFVFINLDYIKYLVGNKVVPYLNNDDETEFGEYDIFNEEDDEDENDDEEHEED